MAKRRDSVATPFGLMIEVNEKSDAPDISWAAPAAQECAPAGQTLDRLLGDIATRYRDATAILRRCSWGMRCSGEAARDHKRR